MQTLGKPSVFFAKGRRCLSCEPLWTSSRKQPCLRPPQQPYIINPLTIKQETIKKRNTYEHRHRITSQQERPGEHTQKKTAPKAYDLILRDRQNSDWTQSSADVAVP